MMIVFIETEIYVIASSFTLFLAGKGKDAFEKFMPKLLIVILPGKFYAWKMVEKWPNKRI